ncbi:MAG TPA: hypothetical protein VFV81_02525, partial [Verrucomicrobiae bacterium]|nr:hypothetical protein [Verrucomicrobiae bacterium]
MRSSDQRIQPWLIAIGLMALVAAVFGQTLNFDFVNFDDGVYVYGSSAVKSGLTWHSMVWAFTHFHAMFWQPLTTLSLMLDYQWHGLRAGGFHLGNVLLHAATVVALFLFLRDVTRQPWASAAAAAIFAVHPLRAESVAWVTERKDVLSGLFFVLTLWAYARYARRPWSLGRYLPVPLLFALGLMSKSMLITLPVILVLLDYWPLRRFPPGGEGWRRLIFEKVPLVVIAIAFSAVTLVAQAQARPVVPIPLSFRLANAVISVVVYLRQLFCPINLAVFYPLPTAGYSALSVILAILLVAGVAAAAIYWTKKYPWFVVGWCWYLVMLVPIIGIVQVGGQAHADRFTYLPQIGLVIAIVWAVAELTKTLPQRRTWLTIAALVVIGVL